MNKLTQLRLFSKSLYRIKMAPSTFKYSVKFESESEKKPLNLLKLPVPELSDTLNVYLKSVKPFLNINEFLQTEQMVSDFISKDGQKLHTLLKQRQEKMDNWLSDWWLNVAYLEYRAPVVVYSSPGQIFPLQKFENENDMINYAANLIVASVHYKLQIDQNKIPQEKMGKDNLDMSQYKKVFGTCRQPFAKRDKLVFHPNSKHIIVTSNGNYYKLNVLNEAGQLFSVKQIFNAVKNIYNESKCKKGAPIGVLTSQGRDEWAEAYQCLLSIAENKKSINEIESSLFLMSLDESIQNSGNDSTLTKAAYQLIHAMGTGGNINNRWYDKTIQLAVSPDGISGITYEHSPSEGQPIAVFTDYVMNFVEKDLGVNIDCLKETPTLEVLPFKANETVQKMVEKANKNIDSIVNNLKVQATVFDGFGKNFIKQYKLSPDSFIQMAIQLAFYRVHNVPGAHYESASLRKFVDGRTECIRSCSEESIQFAQIMLDPRESNNNKFTALRNAISAHKNYVQKAINGQGCDRYLLGLKLIAIENNLPVHNLYKDIGFTRSAHMRLSTSQVASKCKSFMCYGPLVDDGYGCCYNPRDDDIIFGISSFNNLDVNLSHFVEALVTSLHEMENVLKVKSQLSKL